MNTRDIVVNSIKIGIGGALGFGMGCLIGNAVGNPLGGGAALGTAAVANGIFRTIIDDQAKKNDWDYTVTSIAKTGVSTVTTAAGRSALIGLEILHPGKAACAGIWTGIGVITGIAQMALTLLIHKVAEHFDWGYSVVMILETVSSILSEIISLISLIALGLLVPTAGAIALGIAIPLLLSSVNLYRAISLIAGNADVPFRKVSQEKIDPFAPKPNPQPQPVT